MKRAIDRLIEKELTGVDIYSHNGSMWVIFTEEKRWVFEYTEDNILWYNYSLFNNVFKFVSLDVTENTEYITDWFTENILNKPLWVCGDKFVIEKGVISINENSIKETEGNIPIVERSLENGIMNTDYKFDKDEPDVEDTIQNGVKHTLSEKRAKAVYVEDTIQNGVKHTQNSYQDIVSSVEDIIQNGVKQIYDDCYHHQERVNGVIKIGTKM